VPHPRRIADGQSAAGAPKSLRDEALEAQVTDYLSHLLAGCHLYPDRFCAEHFWLTPTSGDAVLLGLHEHLIRILGPISDVVTPRAGIHLESGAPCGWITRASMAFTLYMPLSGEIDGVNTTNADSLRSSPRPASEEWLLKVATTQALDRVEGLRRGEEALRWYLEKIHTLKRFLREAISSAAEDDLARLAADGGVPSDDLEQVLGRASFERLVKQIL
jgi:glycine cleavage system H lipoate-binding protein